jgi:hypothetical protein
MQKSFEQRKEDFAKVKNVNQSVLDVNEVMTTMIRRTKQGLLDPKDKGFIHGMTWQEVARTFGHVKNKTLKEYANRQRDLFNQGFAGKHYVHGEIHYFPLKLDAEGIIEHSSCSCKSVTGQATNGTR